MKKIVLTKEANRVLWLAFRKKGFLNKFLKNPGRASTAERITLTPDDVRSIRALFSARIAIKGRDFTKLIYAVHHGSGIRSAAAKLPPKPPPPPPPWMELTINVRAGGV